MRFIREIIGEKRNEIGQPGQAPADLPGNQHLADQILTRTEQMSDQARGLSAGTPAQPAPGQPADFRTKAEALKHIKVDDLSRVFAEGDELADTGAGASEELPQMPALAAAPQRSAAQGGAQATAPDAPAPAEQTTVAASERNGAEVADAAPGPVQNPNGSMRTAPAAASETAAQAPADAGRATMPGTPEPGRPGEQPDPHPKTITTEPPAQPAPDPIAAQAALQANEPRAETPAEPVAPQSVEVPQPAVGRGSSRHGRVKTRLLGFGSAQGMGEESDADQPAQTAAYTEFPVGWLIVVEGAGRGSAFTLFNGVSKIGRGEGQTIRLDFGDNSISRENHASIAYDPALKCFFIGHGGKANLVRRNGRPVLSTEEMAAGDHITIGETKLRFVPLCGPDFFWDAPQEAGRTHAAHD